METTNQVARSVNIAGTAVCAEDQRILDDYQQFRKVRVAAYICPGQWAGMTKRTKAALLRMIDLAQAAAKAGKL